jgi:hypothetical protein
VSQEFEVVIVTDVLGAVQSVYSRTIAPAATFRLLVVWPGQLTVTSADVGPPL